MSITAGAELREIIDRLQHLGGGGIVWIGDAESERRAALDAANGYALARQALRRARAGLALWDADDVEGAEEYRDEVIGMVAYLRCAGVDLDGKPVYGRPGSSRNETLRRLVDKKRAATGAKVDDCIVAVLVENPDLARRFATRDPASLLKAYKRGQKV
jgi:hypothetical protein